MTRQICRMSYLAERRLEEKEGRRLEILEAAAEVAGVVGFDAMTMEQVARKARLSRALVYVYFKDKHDLLIGLCVRALEVLRERFNAAVAAETQGYKQVEACGRAYVRFASDHPTLFDALAQLRALTSNHGPVADRCRPGAAHRCDRAAQRRQCRRRRLLGRRLAQPDGP